MPLEKESLPKLFRPMQGKGRALPETKPDYSLLPVEPLEAMVRVLTLGASGKHERDGWKLKPAEFHFAAAMRHLVEWRMGVRADHETGESPLVHAANRLFFILWLEAEENRSFTPLSEAFANQIARQAAKTTETPGKLPTDSSAAEGAGEKWGSLELTPRDDLFHTIAWRVFAEAMAEGKHHDSEYCRTRTYELFESEVRNLNEEPSTERKHHVTTDPVF